MVRFGGDRTASEHKHEQAWPKFVEYVKKTLDKVDEYPYEDFVRNAAKRANVSIYTVEHRYLRREDCTAGFLRTERIPEKGKWPRVVFLNREITKEDYEP